MDGKSFLGKNITSESVNDRDETFSYADRFDEKYDMVRSLRKGKYKYIRNYQPFNFHGLLNQYRYKQLAFQECADLYGEGKLNEIQSQFYKSREVEQLFDVENDPYETENLAKDPANKNLLISLRKGLNSYLIDLPDLSFYPEHFLIANAFGNPEKFGQTNKVAISKYIQIADLGLLTFENAKKKIKTALASNDPWERYWAIVVCSSFGKEAIELATTIKEISKTDSEKINKIRALEYFGFTSKSFRRNGSYFKGISRYCRVVINN